MFRNFFGIALLGTVLAVSGIVGIADGQTMMVYRYDGYLSPTVSAPYYYGNTGVPYVTYQVSPYYYSRYPSYYQTYSPVTVMPSYAPVRSYYYYRY
jgi:hypothetical protein